MNICSFLPTFIPLPRVAHRDPGLEKEVGALCALLGRILDTHPPQVRWEPSTSNRCYYLTQIPQETVRSEMAKSKKLEGRRGCVVRLWAPALFMLLGRLT